MILTKEGLELIKHFEGLRLKAYDDGYGFLTIGYGHTGRDVHPERVLTLDEAEKLLDEDTERTMECVHDLCTAELTPNQCSALVSFTFNLGCGNLKRSSLLSLLNLGHTSSAADEFLKWNKVRGIEVDGLTARRTAERELFLKET